jgi:hypothetical protein
VVLDMCVLRFASHLRRGPTVGVAIALGALLVLVGLPGDWGSSYGQTIPGCIIDRPPVALAVTRVSAGRLQVTVTATTNPTVTTNVIQSLVIGPPSGGLIDIPGGVTGATGTVTVTVQPPSSTFIFFIRQQGSGAATVPFTVNDTCGAWQTFAGAGPAGFAAPVVGGVSAAPAVEAAAAPAAAPPAALSSAAQAAAVVAPPADNPASAARPAPRAAAPSVAPAAAIAPPQAAAPPAPAPSSVYPLYQEPRPWWWWDLWWPWWWSTR